MEITTENFQEMFPIILESIESCTFLSIDCEFSGLFALSDANAYDSPSQYYQKMAKNCRNFLVLQYGLSAFQWNGKEFDHKSFNFYIFRKPLDRNIPDQRFLCQTSCIDFLSHQQFDFNKLFRSGLSYLNMEEEFLYKTSLEEKTQQKNSSPDIIPVPLNCVDIVNNLIGEIDSFLATTDKEETVLSKCNPFVRRLLYQTVNEKYKDRLIMKTVGEGQNRLLQLTRINAGEDADSILKQYNEEKVTKKWQTYDTFLGFSKVMKALVKAEKPIIGHNMLLDVFHSIDKFLSPLNENYEEFKECAHSLFPKIIDTKYLCSCEPLQDLIQSSVLKDVLGTVTKSPFQLPPITDKHTSFHYAIADNKDHQAGYDAYMTGVVFIALWSYLIQQKKTTAQTDPYAKLDALEPFLNKICMNYLRDQEYINLAGKDLTPSRDHVFHLTFPKEWKTSNIAELFSPFGVVYVSWINSTSAFVSLRNKEQAACVLSKLNSTKQSYTIMSFKKFQSLSAEQRTHKQSIPSHPIKRKGSLSETVDNTPHKKRSRTIKGNNKWNKRQTAADDLMSDEPVEENEEFVCERKVTKNTSSTEKLFDECEWD